MSFHAYPLSVTCSHLRYITHPTHLDVVYVRIRPTAFLDIKNGCLPGSSLISHSYCEILVTLRSVSRHFEFLRAWLIIWRHLRHHKKFARAPLPVGGKCMNKGCDETGCDFGTEYTTDLLQSSNLEETVYDNLIDVLLHHGQFQLVQRHTKIANHIDRFNDVTANV